MGKCLWSAVPLDITDSLRLHPREVGCARQGQERLRQGARRAPRQHGGEPDGSEGAGTVLAVLLREEGRLPP